MSDRKKIMLIDDDIDFVEIHARYLREAGYDVVAAYSGEGVMERAVKEDPDVIVLDVIMSTNTEGFEVARRLRRDARTSKIPVLMLTAINESEYRLPRALGNYDEDPTWNPVDVFLNKPVSPKELLSEVDRLLRV